MVRYATDLIIEVSRVLRTFSADVSYDARQLMAGVFLFNLPLYCLVRFVLPVLRKLVLPRLDLSKIVSPRDKK